MFFKVTMLKLALCKEILNKKGKKYSNQQVLKIRELLVLYSKIHIESIKEFENEKKSNHLY